MSYIVKLEDIESDIIFMAQVDENTDTLIPGTAVPYSGDIVNPEFWSDTEVTSMKLYNFTNVFYDKSDEKWYWRQMTV